jgi:FkbM family methyltransferase
MNAVGEARAILGYVWNHPANEQHRFRACVRAGTFQLRGRCLRRPTVVSFGATSRIMAELHVTSSSKVVYASPPDWNEMLAWRRLLGPGDLFIDGGANVGVYSIWAAEAGARVIAVEPDAEAGGRLRRNVDLNGYEVEVVAAALTRSPGPVRLSVGLDTVNRLVEAGGVVVAGTTLDEILDGRRAAGVKLDLEGAERLAIEGGADALSERRIDCLQIEWNRCSVALLGETREPVARLLRDWGYGLYRPDRTGALQTLDDLAYGPDVFAALR